MEKGSQNICYNSSFTSSLSLIGAITSLGDWFFSSLNSRNNSEFFYQFYEWFDEMANDWSQDWLKKNNIHNG